MKGFNPYFTADGSTGLYSEDFNDIYHSVDGALTEAIEKFITPIPFGKLIFKNEIKVLDLCYGIGYNSKSFLNFILNLKKILKNKNKNLKNFPKILSHANQDIVSIYTYNIFSEIFQNLNRHNIKYNDTIYTDNIFNKIFIKAVDNDKFLTSISPLIKTGKKNVEEYINKNFDEKYMKIFKNSKNIKIQKIDKLINFLIFEKIWQKSPEIYLNEAINQAILDSRYYPYFETDIRGILSFYLNNYNNSIPNRRKFLNLHNIYYRYISNCYKKALKHYNLWDFDFIIENDDARCVVKNDNNTYNLIFLDAFSPNKCPCLWSLEFFKELYRILDDDGMLITYSSSASVRNAMVNAGFEIGNNYNIRLNKINGTIAVKNKELIKYPLSEFDFGLLKTRAGVFYRDENLTGQNEAIIERRKEDVKNSNLISSTRYIKNYKA